MQLLQNRIVSPQPAPVPPRKQPQTLVVLDSSFNPPTAAHLRMATSAVAGENLPGPVRLLLVLGVDNADKAVGPAALEQRLGMMWAFARDVRNGLDGTGSGSSGGREGVSIDVCLSKQPYFHDKSEAIAASNFYKVDEGEEAAEASNTKTEQVILVGYDTLIRILDPKYYGTSTTDVGAVDVKETPVRKALGPFFERARLRVTARTDAEWGGKDDQAAYLDGLVNGDGLQKIGGNGEWAKRIETVEGRKEGEPLVSSTLAREAAKGKDWARFGELVSHGVKRWAEGEKLYSGGS